MKINIDYTKGFPLPRGRRIVGLDEDGESSLGEKTELKEDKRLFIDIKNIILVNQYKKINPLKLKMELEKKLLLLDYGACRYFFENPRHIPMRWRKDSKIAFFGCILGWLHLYTGYILEHIQEEIPVLHITNHEIKIVLEDIHASTSWDIENIPIVAYPK